MIDRFLFCLTLFISALLVALVCCLPWLPDSAGAHPFLRLLAEDSIIRRAAVACAAGLTITAFAFFRANARKVPSAVPASEKKNSKRRRSRTTVGA